MLPRVYGSAISRTTAHAAPGAPRSPPKNGVCGTDAPSEGVSVPQTTINWGVRASRCLLAGGDGDLGGQRHRRAEVRRAVGVPGEPLHPGGPVHVAPTAGGVVRVVRHPVLAARRTEEVPVTG